MTINNSFEYKVFLTYMKNKRYEKDNIIFSKKFYTLIINILQNERYQIINTPF